MGGWGALEQTRAPKAVELLQLVSFSVADGEYALDIMRIKEIINPVEVTRVPRAPEFIEGVIGLRGAILPIVDMRKRFDLPVSPRQRSTKYVIVGIDVGGGRRAGAPERMIVGLVVDKVSEPLRIPRGEVRPAPALTQSGTPYFSGAVRHHGRILMIVDLDAVLSTQEKLSLAGLKPSEALP
jgi:purine-binding chemotaxis protein CheW